VCVCVCACVCVCRSKGQRSVPEVGVCLQINLLHCHYYFVVIVVVKNRERLLTSDEHDAYGEDLLGVGVGRNVTEAY